MCLIYNINYFNISIILYNLINLNIEGEIDGSVLYDLSELNIANIFPIIKHKIILRKSIHNLKERNSSDSILNDVNIIHIENESASHLDWPLR